MYSDSRKAQRNSFAHQRAEFLFSNPDAKPDVSAGPATAAAEADDHTAQSQSLRLRVRAGLRGFAPAVAA